MKRFLTLAIVALLLGGFAFNANAQERKAKPANNKEKVVKKEVKVKGENLEQTLKDFETTVDKCVSYYQNMIKNTGSNKDVTKQFNEALAKAEKMKTQLDKAKGELTRSQVNRFNKATRKLSQVYVK